MNFNELNRYVIHLPERHDRFESLNEQLPFLGSKHIQIVNGIIDPNPMKGIGQAHVNCILLAKQKELSSVLIMEDDIVFNGKEKTIPYINEALLNAPSDWDILLGGVYYCKSTTPYNDYWNKIGEFCGAHFYIVNSKAYDKILEYDFTQHFDRWLNMNNRLNCYVSKKFFAIQKDGYSDNVKKKVDYKSNLKKFELL